MWKPRGSLILVRFFLIASALGPVCGMVGMWGEAPVTLNWPSFSRLPGAFCAKAETAVNSVAAETADNKRICIREPFLQRALPAPPFARRHSHIAIVFPR